MISLSLNQNNMQDTTQKLKLDSQNPVIYDNTIREVIQIMPDTLENKLRDFEESLKKKGSIFNDIELISAFLATLVTVSAFKDFLNIPAHVWQSVFIVFLIFSFGKLCCDVYFAFGVRSINRKDILRQLLDETRKKIA